MFGQHNIKLSTMIDVITEIQIEAPLETVFTYASDPDNAAFTFLNVTHSYQKHHHGSTVLLIYGILACKGELTIKVQVASFLMADRSPMITWRCFVPHFARP